VEEEKKEVQPEVNDTPVVEENKQPKKKGNKLFIIIIIIIALALAYGCGLYLGKELYGKEEPKEESKQEEPVSDEPTKEQTPDEPTPDEPKNGVINLTDSEVSNLLDILPNINDSCYKSIVFQNNKVTTSNASKEIMTTKAIVSSNHASDECTKKQINANGICDYTVKVSDVKAKLKSLYDVEYSSLPKSIKKACIFSCTLVDDVYACSISGGGYAAEKYDLYFDTIASKDNYYTNYVKAEKEDGYLNLYVDFVNVRFGNIDSTNLDTYTFKLYKYSNTDDLIIDKTYYGKDFYKEDSVTKFKDQVLKEAKGKTITYKIVYKINDDNTYAWVSAEPLN
jgi:hypothetical protein